MGYAGYQLIMFILVLGHAAHLENMFLELSFVCLLFLDERGLQLFLLLQLVMPENCTDSLVSARLSYAGE